MHSHRYHCAAQKTCHPFPPLNSRKAAFKKHTERTLAVRALDNPGCPKMLELHMFQRSLEEKRALNVYAGEHRECACPSAFQWAIVSNLVKTLIPGEEVTLKVSHYNTPASCIRMTCPQHKVLEHWGKSWGTIWSNVSQELRTKNCAVCMYLRSSLQKPCILLWCYTDQSQRIAERGGRKCYTGHCRYKGIQGRRACCWTASCCRSEPKGNV